VHIEAEKHEAATKGYGRGRLVEEAGSGVVIELKDSYYVLTNRHVIKDAQLNDIKIRSSDGNIINPAKVWSIRTRHRRDEHQRTASGRRPVGQ